MYRGGALTVRTVSSTYWCPAEAWLQVHGPRLPWNAPHYDPLSEEAREALSSAEEIALRLVPEGSEVLREPYIYSPALRLGGRPDILAIAGDRLVVVELKARRPLPGSPARVQAALYTVVAEHHYSRPARGYLAYPGGAQRIGRRDVRLALRLVEEARRILQQPAPPPPSGAAHKCRTCLYRHVCPWSRA